MTQVRIGDVVFSGQSLGFVLGPCVIESEQMCLETGLAIKEIAQKLGAKVVFKASFDKANRSSISSFRGPGLSRGLDILARVKQATGLPVMTDIHEAWQAEPAAQVVDAIQIPAFLVRQTDLVLAAARTGKALNLKKAQFMAPANMRGPVEKALSAKNNSILLTERGTFFGYNDLVVDFRALAIMRDIGFPVLFDATHSVQKPGALKNASGGEPRFTPGLARAAVAFGVEGIFMEVHPNPAKALSDSQVQFPLSRLEQLMSQLLRIKSLGLESE